MGLLISPNRTGMPQEMAAPTPRPQAMPPQATPQAMPQEAERSGWGADQWGMLAAIGSGMVNLGQGRPVNIMGNPVVQAMVKRREGAEKRKEMKESGLLDGFSAQQREVLAMMPPALAQKVIMEAAFAPPSKPDIREVNGGLYNVGAGSWVLEPEATGPDFEAGSKLRKEWNSLTAVEDLQGKLAAYNSVKSAAEVDTPAGDIALVFQFMKALDPQSVVREGEFATAQNAASVPERIRAMYNRTLQGTRLTDDIRQDFVNTALGEYRNAERRYDLVRGQYEGIANRNRFSVPDVLPDYRMEDTGETVIETDIGRVTVREITPAPGQGPAASSMAPEMSAPSMGMPPPMPGPMPIGAPVAPMPGLPPVVMDRTPTPNGLPRPGGFFD